MLGLLEDWLFLVQSLFESNCLVMILQIKTIMFYIGVMVHSVFSYFGFICVFAFSISTGSFGRVTTSPLSVLLNLLFWLQIFFQHVQVYGTVQTDGISW